MYWVAHPIIRRGLILASAFAALTAVPFVTSGAATLPQSVKVTLTDTDGEHMTINVDRTAIRSGPVTFEVSNLSQDQVHEMLVIKSDGAGGPLPYDNNQEKVIEEKTQDLGEVSDLDPGKSGTLTLDLAPGRYILLCNEPGHFMHGMQASLSVSD